MVQIFLYIGSYLVGSIPFGLLFGKMAGVDVRTKGSRNIGATNVSRLIGKKFGLFTLLCDLLKGALPVLMAMWLLPDGSTRQMAMVICGLLAVIGHMFPIYLGFKGGKGVATGLGVFLVVSPWSVLISAALFIGAVFFSGFVSVGSLAASALLPLWLFLLGEPKVVVTGGLAVGLLIWIKHHENIARLIKGEEKSWKKKK